eukprot:4949169-Alexandrium_andersonii.AAC.1
MTSAVSTSHATTTASQPRPVGAAAAAAGERCASQSLSGFQSRATSASGRGPSAATAAWSHALLAVHGGTTT